MFSGAVGDLVKKRRPSLEGLVRAERREEIVCRTGVAVDSDFEVVEDGLILVDCVLLF
jgi:hypothetical protein